MDANYIRYLDILAAPKLVRDVKAQASASLAKQAACTGACSLHFGLTFAMDLHGVGIAADTAFVWKDVFIPIRFTEPDEKLDTIELVQLNQEDYLTARVVHSKLVESAFGSVCMAHYRCRKCMPTPFHYVEDYEKHGWQVRLPIRFTPGVHLEEVTPLHQVAAAHHFWVIRGKPAADEWWRGLLEDQQCKGNFNYVILFDLLSNCWRSFGAEIQANVGMTTASDLAGVSANLLGLPDPMETSQPASVNVEMESAPQQAPVTAPAGRSWSAVAAGAPAVAAVVTTAVASAGGQKKSAGRGKKTKWTKLNF